jgi:dolichol-phosphate mannosyltransferase
VPEEGLPALSIVIPSRNEAGNIEPLVRRLEDALAHFDGDWELIFVDDSDDATPEVIELMANQGDYRLMLLHRGPGQRDGGLGGAVKHGFSKASGRVIVVMDADLQHPPEVVPSLVKPVLSREYDIVAGSRYGLGGSRDGLAGPLRHIISRSCRWLAHRLVANSRPFSDPMGGFFALNPSVVDRAPLRPEGYKILLEIAARGDWRSVLNVDYDFDERYSGRSKAQLREGLVFLRHLWRLSTEARRLEASGRPERVGKRGKAR